MEGKRHKGSAHQLAVPANSGGTTIPPVISTEMTRAVVLASYSRPPEWYPIQQSVKQDLVRLWNNSSSNNDYNDHSNTCSHY